MNEDSDAFLFLVLSTLFFVFLYGFVNWNQTTRKANKVQSTKHKALLRPVSRCAHRSWPDSRRGGCLFTQTLLNFIVRDLCGFCNEGLV